MKLDTRSSRRAVLRGGTAAFALTAPIGIGPRFLDIRTALAADALAPGMIGGPTGFDGAERYQYTAHAP